jgi:hypothetical protein
MDLRVRKMTIKTRKLSIFLIISYVFSLANKRAEQVLPGSWLGEVAQIMYTHVK